MKKKKIQPHGIIVTHGDIIKPYGRIIRKRIAVMPHGINFIKGK